MYSMELASTPHVPPITQMLHVNEHLVKFETDTGCSVTVLSQAEYAKMDRMKRLPLNTSTVRLKTYTGQPVNILGTTKVKVTHKGRTKELTAVVVMDSGPNLLGRAWLTELKISWENINKMEGCYEMLQDILQKHQTVFKDELGMLKGTRAKIYVQYTEMQSLVFFKPRSLPFAMKDKVEVELDRLLKENIIEPGRSSSASVKAGWISKIVWRL